MTPPAAATAPAVQPHAPLAPGRPRTAPKRPRRVSGPARPNPATRPARGAQADGGLALGALRALDGISHHRLLDRLIRGRTSIALVTFALIGIVTLQLGLLKLNSSIGHTLERESLLQRENAALSIENSELAAGEHVAARASQLGMQRAPLSALRFLAARPGTDAARGAAALKTTVQSSSGEAKEGESRETNTASSTSSTSSTATSGAEAASSSPSSEASSTAQGEAKQAPGEGAAAPAGASAPATPQAPVTSSSAPAASGSESPETGPGGGTQATPTG
jgi:hypothetical protein